MTELTKTEIQHELWRRGNLTWLMHPIQREMYDAYKNSGPRSTLVWLLARQSGKSWLLTLIALEQCIKFPNSVVKMMTDTKVHLESIYEPLFNEILQSCPDDVKPTYVKKTFAYVFANGSQIQLAGSDGGHAERLRGQKSPLVIIDEAGFCKKLRYNVRSILIPTLTHTRGKIVMASTPSLESDHDFHYFVEKAEMEEKLIKKTVYDNPLLDQSDINSIIEEQGGINSPDFRREYMCEVIRNEDMYLFPEFDDDLQAKVCIPWERPPFFDAYVGMDLGYKDLTAIIFIYYDFLKRKIIIDDEIVVQGKDIKLPKLSMDILEKEKILWTNNLTNEQVKPRLRVSDIDYLVTNEMNRISGYKLNFVPAEKDDKATAVNQLRVMLSNEQIIINPRCQHLIRHLSNCRWKAGDSKKAIFARSPDHGHYDTVDALLYALRKVEMNRNPYPSNYQIDTSDLHIQKPDRYNREVNDSISVFRKIFNK